VRAGLVMRYWNYIDDKFVFPGEQIVPKIRMLRKFVPQCFFHLGKSEVFIEIIR
jgi:hypothetical protein